MGPIGPHASLQLPPAPPTCLASESETCVMEKREPGAGDTVKREEPRAAGSGDAAGAGGPGSAAGVGAKLSSHPKPPSPAAEPSRGRSAGLGRPGALGEPGLLARNSGGESLTLRKGSPGSRAGLSWSKR